MRAALMVLLLGAGAAQAQIAPADGKTIFSKNCAACHQASGAGIPGAFPALKANTFLQGEPDPVIATVLKGRAGMPAFAASLDDAQLATVLTYARSAWGNKAGAISAEQSAAGRNAANAPASDQPKSTIIH